MLQRGSSSPVTLRLSRSCARLAAPKRCSSRLVTGWRFTQSQTNRFLPTKLRDASPRQQIAMPTITRLRSIVTRTTNACSIFSESRRGSTQWLSARARFSGQAKKAYESARTSGAVGPYLHRLFQRAFRVAKQVRTHTDIARGAVSVGSVAVELAQRIFGKLSECKVLVLGAGETSERTTRALVSRGVTDLRVSNRSLDRARELAQMVGGQAVVVR